MSIPFMRKLPLPVYYPEGNILMRRTGGEVEEYSFIISRFFNNFIRRSLRLVNKVGIKDIELNSSEPGCARTTDSNLTL